MGVTPIKREILNELDSLSPELQRKVLSFIQALKSSLAGTPGEELLRFAGIFTAEEAKAMKKAIEEGCEQVDSGEW